MTPVRPRGIYRIRYPGGIENDVQVADSGVSTPMKESDYRTKGYEPSVDSLPWRDDYFAAQQKCDTKK